MKIKIGMLEYEVKFLDKKLEFDGDKVFGQVDECAQVIKISTKACKTDARIRQTVLHEVLHAAGWYCGIDLPEPEVVALGNVLSDMLYESPGLLDLHRKK